jgi:tetratricopeptide (TPR) repeat protein
MADAWTVLYSFILSILINIISDLLGVRLTFKKSIIVFLFILSFFIIYLSIDHSEIILPSGFDTKESNVPAAWNNLGYLNYTKGKYNDSIKCYDEAIRLNPSYSIAWSNKGNALKKLGDLGEAKAAFNEAIIIENQEARN